MNRPLLRTLIATFAGACILSGCETIGPAIGLKPAASSTAASATPGGKPGSGAAAGAQSKPAMVTDEQTGLKEGIDLYNRGAFHDAIKRLASPEVTGGAKATQLEALKYTAFSYCVTSRQVLCRQAFEKAFRLDRSFKLAPGEHGHPLWGPAFARAKKNVK